jgi:biopolymer transport protein ExbD
MIDVFAILVFFLLSNAALVFAKLHVVEMSLPSSSQPDLQPQDPGLQVIIRGSGIEIRQRDTAPLGLPRRAEGYDLAALSLRMQQLKRRYPAARDAVLLIERDVPYDSLVQVIDAVRNAPSPRPGLVAGDELFPDISLGDAPAGTP